MIMTMHSAKRKKLKAAGWELGAGDPCVSIDLLMKSLLALGAPPKEVAKAISLSTSHAA
jgi:hypothetical protein